MDFERLTKKEIINTYQMFSSPNQKKALRYNYYLQGFGEAILELVRGVEPLKDNSTEEDYIFGRKEAIWCLKQLHLEESFENIQEFYKKLAAIP